MIGLMYASRMSSLQSMGYCLILGRPGRAITLVSQFDVNLIHAVEDKISELYNVSIVIFTAIFSRIFMVFT